MSIALDPGSKGTKGIFDRSEFKVTRDISPTISGWLLVCAVAMQACMPKIADVYVVDRYRLLRSCMHRWTCNPYTFETLTTTDNDDLVTTNRSSATNNHAAGGTARFMSPVCIVVDLWKKSTPPALDLYSVVNSV